MAEVFKVEPVTSDSRLKLINGEPIVRLNANGQGAAPFKVSNKTERPLRGLATVVPVAPAPAAWFKLAGAVDREINEPETFTVNVEVPPGTQAGTYRFRLAVASVRNKDEDGGSSPDVAVTVAEETQVITFKWWWLAAAAALVLAIGFLIIRMLPGDRVPTPAVTGKTLAQAEAMLMDQHFRVGAIHNVDGDRGSVDKVLTQNPEANAKASPGTEVSLGVGVAQTAVPRVRNLSYLQGVAALLGSGLDVGTVTNLNVPGLNSPSLVLDASPKEGSPAKTHDTVDLVVQSQGNATVPSVVGHPIAGAMEDIYKSNLKVAGVLGDPRTVYHPTSLVADQQPKSGQVPLGTPVTLILTKGATSAIPPRIVSATLWDLPH